MPPRIHGARITMPANPSHRFLSAAVFAHESRPRDRRVVVRRDVAKTERDVERLCVAHHRQRVEPDLGVAQPPRFVQRDRDELLREPAPARRWAARTDASSRNITRPRAVAERRIIGGNQSRPRPGRTNNAPARRRIVAGQAGELGVDLLEGEVEPDPARRIPAASAGPRECRRAGRVESRIVQPGACLYSLSSVNAADLALPMLMIRSGGPARDATPAGCANPEVVRLVALARTGDRAAFGRLIEDHLTAARRVALAAVGQPMDADEAVQEASVAAWTRLDALQDPAAFRGWFMRIVWRKAIDRRRSVRSWLDRFGVSSSDDRPMEFRGRRSLSRRAADLARARDRDRAGREGAAAEAARSVPARRERRSSLRRDRDACWAFRSAR